MQLLTTFYEDNKLLALAAAAAAVLLAVFILFLLYRLLFGRRLRTAGNGRVRQPRLGIVDAYDLDRQRQLVLVRRDNVEHLIMIGGPTDVVIESAIVRAQQQPLRDKDAGPAIGPIPTPTVLPAAPQAPALAPAPQAASLAAPIRAEPPLAPPRPIPERPVQDRLPERTTPRPGPASEGRVEPLPIRGGASNGPGPRPPGPPPAPGGTPAAPLPSGASGTPSGPGAEPSPAVPTVRTPPPSRLPPRQPLPPRAAPGGASGLPPRPVRPLPPRGEAPLRVDPGLRSVSEGPPPVSVAGPASAPTGPAVQRGGPGPGSDAEPRIATGPAASTPSEGGTRRIEPPPLAAETPNPEPSARAETLESLEEEMAKLLGRPIPRRDG